MQGTKNLTEGPIKKQLFNLALPIMGTSFIQMAYSITDMAWVGRLGSEAVAAIGAVGILTWMTTSISYLNKVGSEVSVAQSIGAREEDDARAFASHNLMMARTASTYGGHIGLMTMTAGGQIEAIAWNTSQGFSTALSTFVAQNFAARKKERVLGAYHTTLKMTALFGIFCTLLFVFFGSEVFSLIIPEKAAYEAGGVFLRIDGYSMLFMMLEITMQGLFYGTGRTLPPAIISITFNSLRIPMAIGLTAMGLGITGVWWAISISSMLKGIVAFIWFRILQKKIL